MKALILALGTVIVLSSAASAKMLALEEHQLDQVVAGCGGPCEPLRGNNGWGNGADPTNPGSFAGKTAPSKIAGRNLLTGTGVNANPTDSTGR